MLAVRLRAQRLSGPPGRDPVTVTRHLLAIQAQDGRGARLAIRARTPPRTTAADVDRALTHERSLLITWLNRGTLHLVCAEDYRWLHALTAPALLTGNTRRLRQEGVSESTAERAVGVIEDALGREGPRTRAQLADRIAAAGVRTDGQALVHLLALASLRGLIVRGPMHGRQHAYALAHDWLGPAGGPVDRDAALAELARRYLIGHGPAGAADLAKWAGLPLRDARAGLDSIAGEIQHRADDLVQLKRAPAAARRLPPPRLLGAFDPVLHGWRTRTEVTGEHDRAVVSGGLFRPFALVGGRAAATWRIDGRSVQIDPFTVIPAEQAVALEADGEAAVHYLGL